MRHVRWSEGFSLLLVAASVLGCAGAADTARQEVAVLLRCLDTNDEPVLAFDGPIYSPEMERLIEIGKPGVPFLASRLKRALRRNVADAIVVVLGDIGDSRATEAIVTDARRLHRRSVIGQYPGSHVDALAQIGDRKALDFLQEVYLWCLTPEHIPSSAEHRASMHRAVVEGLINIGGREVMPTLMCAAGDEHRGRGSHMAVEALRSWTGQDFGNDSLSWIHWWKEHEWGFQWSRSQRRFVPREATQP